MVMISEYQRFSTYVSRFITSGMEDERSFVVGHAFLVTVPHLSEKDIIDWSRTLVPNVNSSFFGWFCCNWYEVVSVRRFAKWALNTILMAKLSSEGPVGSLVNTGAFAPSSTAQEDVKSLFAHIHPCSVLSSIVHNWQHLFFLLSVPTPAQWWYRSSTIDVLPW